MISSCCGKSLHRLDVRPVVVKICGKYYPGTQDLNTLVARWKCSVCGKEYSQRKRQRGAK